MLIPSLSCLIICIHVLRNALILILNYFVTVLWNSLSHNNLLFRSFVRRSQSLWSSSLFVILEQKWSRTSWPEYGIKKLTFQIFRHSYSTSLINWEKASVTSISPPRFTRSTSHRFFSFVKFFNEKIMYPTIYRVVSSSYWLRGYDSSAPPTLTCLQHSLFLLSKNFCRKPSSKLPYERSPTFSEHILTDLNRFSHKIFFQYCHLSGSRLYWSNNENIFSLSTHFVPVKLTNS